MQKKIESKGKFTHKLSSKEVSDIQCHFESDDVSFPLPDKKFEGKLFKRQSVKKSLRMYNDLATASHKISLSTYYSYKPKNVKFQGKYLSDKVVARSVKMQRTSLMRLVNI